MPAVKPLFSDHYLSKRLPEEPAWAEDEQAEATRQQLLKLYHATRSGLEGAKESQTEDDFIKPALEILGWHFIVQQGRRTTGVLDIPDYVLFTSAEKRERANAIKGDPEKQAEFWSLVDVIADAKKWDRPLSSRTSDPGDNTDPNFQMVRYIRTFEAADWGILTNG